MLCTTHLSCGWKKAIYSGHHLEAWGHASSVLGLDFGVAFHVRLSETEVDVEVGVEIVRLVDRAAIVHLGDVGRCLFEECDVGPES